MVQFKFTQNVMSRIGKYLNEQVRKQISETNKDIEPYVDSIEIQEGGVVE